MCVCIPSITIVLYDIARTKIKKKQKILNLFIFLLTEKKKLDNTPSKWKKKYFKQNNTPIMYIVKYIREYIYMSAS